MRTLCALAACIVCHRYPGDIWDMLKSPEQQFRLRRPGSADGIFTEPKFRGRPIFTVLSNDDTRAPPGI